jgi:transcriptional regulator with XRE-family HTH domain
MKIQLLLADNIKELLDRRKASQHDLAHWCRKTDAWLTNVLNGKRGVFVEDLDRMADFFGYAGSAYKLFLPGVAAHSERRKVNRRSGQERRIGQQQRVMEEYRPAIERARRPPLSYERDSLSPVAAARLAKLQGDFDRRLARLLAEDTRRQARGTRGTITAPPARGRRAGGSDVESS